LEDAYRVRGQEPVKVPLRGLLLPRRKPQELKFVLEEAKIFETVRMHKVFDPTRVCYEGLDLTTRAPNSRGRFSCGFLIAIHAQHDDPRGRQASGRRHRQSHHRCR
jgi:hypothetical protein